MEHRFARDRGRGGYFLRRHSRGGVDRLPLWSYLWNGIRWLEGFAPLRCLSALCERDGDDNGEDGKDAQDGMNATSWGVHVRNTVAESKP